MVADANAGIADTVPAMIKAANGHHYKETTTTTIKRGGEVILEKTEVHERYAPPDPQAAHALFTISEAVNRNQRPHG